ncbi:hypothetical protein F7725_028279 [Dissostichus mawsoni]|uniref:LIM zinc-binding domain-containing protein n=1 Tax=Dissostichus mawsoni TaxID=36200 RepID=A0A7J5XFI0_DISMA|nr:hypothetical protein F7725_028279 [Dissostichus mawsoni]
MNSNFLGADCQHHFLCVFSGTMVNPGGSSQPPPVGAGSLSWKRCAGCGGKIADRFLLYTMDSYWHSRCLKCSCCQAQLGEIGTSLFGNSGACSACGQSIPASELVMRAQGNVYHLKCFTCSTCRNRLVPGDRFHYINGSLFCEHDRPTALINGHLSQSQYPGPRCVRRELSRKQEVCLHFSPHSCHRDSVDQQPSLLAVLQALCPPEESSTHPTSYMTLISAAQSPASTSASP